MGSGGIFHKFWCDKCQCYVDFSDFETCESICEYCEAKENKARAEAAEAEVGRLRAELATMPRPEDRCNGEWPCEASTALAFAEAEMARAEARAEAAEAEAARSARFLGECGYLVGIEVYSPDDIPVVAERLGALHTRAEAAEQRAEAAEAELAQARADRALMTGLWLITVPHNVLPTLLPTDQGDRDRLAAALDAVDLQPSGAARIAAARAVVARIVALGGAA